MWLLAAVLSVLIGLSLGLLGGGGSMLTVPILIYVLGVEPKSAIATSLLVVGVASAVGVISHARAGRVKFRMGLLFGVAGMAGAYAGGRVAHFRAIFRGGILRGDIGRRHIARRNVRGRRRRRRTPESEERAEHQSK